MSCEICSVTSIRTVKMVSNLCKHIVEFRLLASMRRLARETEIMSQYDLPYRMVKTKGAKTAVFIRIEDPDALDTFRVRHGNRDLVVSVAFCESAGPSSRCVYALCFHVRSSSLEQARQSALEVVYYLAEHCGIPPESLDLIFNGGGLVAQDDGRANIGAAAPAEIVILVPPSVFGARPTPHTLTINYDLARQMRAKAVGAISVRPRDDNSFAVCLPVPEATEWFGETLAEKEKHARWQSRLQEHLLRLGWAVPPCIRRLDWAEFSEDNALEACHVIAAFYPFVGAGEDEVWHHVRRIDQRHGLQQSARLRAIVTFGNENPTFECGHPFLQKFCPAGGCFMKKWMDEMKNPRLFT